MRYLSVCSGIEAATVAWAPLGWRAAAFAEVEKFPSAVLAHHYPDVPNLGDMTKIDGEKYRGAVDLIVGGTPCQDFSVAGKRAGMAGERGGLALKFVELVRDVSPRWLVWENVPGILSSNSGDDFASFLLALRNCGYHVAYRVLDAQYFGVPQRRRRVFLVGYLGDWRPAAAVLFEPHCLRRDTPPGGKARQYVAESPGQGASECCYDARGNGDGKTVNTLSGDHNSRPTDYTACVVSQAISCKWSKGTSGPAGDEHHNLIAHAVAFQEAQTGLREYNTAGCLLANGPGHDPVGTRIRYGSSVRRLTPRECERLQGFPDDYTLIPWRGKTASACPDGPRYKALGNSFAVPVMRWIGERINAIRAAREGAA